VSELVRVPDLAGEIVGYRSWLVAGHEEVRLHSLRGTVWPTRRWLDAECYRSGCEIPGEGCSCGIYAARTRDHLLELAYNEDEGGRGARDRRGRSGREGDPRHAGLAG
jgi:hypothetical protein